MNEETITVRTLVEAPIEKVWQCWIEPGHITQWNSGSPDWHTPRAENDVKVGGRFLTRMEAKDGSAGFDFSGTYTEVVPQSRISYVMDGTEQRHATTVFESEGDTTAVSVTFDIEHENPAEMQRDGWQHILDNFKQHVERDH